MPKPDLDEFHPGDEDLDGDAGDGPSRATGAVALGDELTLLGVQGRFDDLARRVLIQQGIRKTALALCTQAALDRRLKRSWPTSTPTGTDSAVAPSAHSRSSLTT